MIEIHPKEIKGSWDQGYVLDVHTVSSTMIGYNEFGYPEFDTLRSPLGELLYRLKYKGDKTVVPAIVEAVAGFLKNWSICPDVVIPMPPSKQRGFQPVVEIASELSKSLGITLDTTSLKKTKTTPQMKDIGDFSARVAASLRANISETPPVVLINEQGEEEKRRYEREFFWCCVGGGRGWRGTKRRRA